jgi:hypothetical protein
MPEYPTLGHQTMITAGSSAVATPRYYWRLWLVVAVVLCVPIWLPSLPPLSDYYNHLARLYIMSHHDAVAEYRQFYVIDWTPSPNLALELVGLPLMAVFSLTVTAKLFLTLAVLLWHLGCTVLARAVHGRLAWRALICSFFVYNQQFLHGYVNFIFSMGLALVVLALWLQSRERWSARRLALVTVLATLAFFAHLSGFATLAVAVAVMILARVMATRALDGHAVASAVPLVPGTLVFVLGFLRQAPGGGGLSFAPLTYNLRDSMTLLTGYDPVVDVVSMMVVAVLIGVVVLARQRLAVKRDVFAAGLVLGVLFWVIPSDAASGVEVNVRFVMGAVTLLVLGFELAVSARVRAGVLAVAMALFVVRTAVTAGAWMELDRQFQAHVAAFQHIEEGAAVHTIYFYPAPRLLNAPRVRGLALIHAAAFAAVERKANVPTLYGIRGQQPLAHRESRYRAHRFQDGQRPRIPWDQVFAAYSYVWTCRAPADVIAPLVERGREVARVESCVLYRL